jgi:integrase
MRLSKFALVIYDFRHTAATWWAERGMDTATLAKALGRANLRSVIRHIHISQQHMDRAILRYGEPQASLPDQQTAQPTATYKAAKSGFVL